jgi:hypothetical protein
MKFLSNFDSHLQENLVKEYQEIFGEDMVIAVNKSKFYYWTSVFTPLLSTFIAIACIFATLIYFDISQWEILLPISILLAFILFFVAHHAFRAYFNYKMDFLLVTPKEIIKYDQEGFFNRKSERLNANIIKSITVRKEGFIQSLFDIGTIVFLTELGTQGIE